MMRPCSCNPTGVDGPDIDCPEHGADDAHRGFDPIGSESFAAGRELGRKEGIRIGIRDAIEICQEKSAEHMKLAFTFDKNDKVAANMHRRYSALLDGKVDSVVLRLRELLK